MTNRNTFASDPLSASNRVAASDGDSSSGIAVGLQKASMIGLGLVIFFAPLFMGGRHPLGKLVYVAAVGFTVVAWLASQALQARAKWIRTPAVWVLVAAIGLVLLQVVPLPAGVLSRLSPSQAENLPLWSSGGESSVQLGTWNRISLSPAATKQGLMVLVAHSLLFVAVVHHVRETADVERLMKWLAIAACGMAALGIAQFLFGNSKFLWIYEHPFRDTNGSVKGAFSNPNHFAHYLALGVGPLIWWLQRLMTGGENGAWSISRGASAGASANGMLSGVKPLLLAGLVAVSLAGLLTFSRGGVLAIFAVASISVLLYARQGIFGRSALIGLGGGAAVVLAALAIHGSDKLMGEMKTLVPQIGEEAEPFNRTLIWNAVLQAAPRYAIAGAGVGSQRDVYPQYIDEEADVEFTHAESGYLHILLEAGIPGLVLALIGISMALTWCWRGIRVAGTGGSSGGSTRIAALSAAILAGLIVSALHSVVDFVWFIPACMSSTIVLAACALRLAQFAGAAKESGTPGRSGRKHEREVDHEVGATREPAAVVEWPRGAWIGGCAAAAAMLLFMVQTWWGPARASGPFEAYRSISREADAAALSGVVPDDESMNEVDQMVRRLEETLQRDSQDARAHMRLAGLYRVLFERRQRESENAMSLTQIRDAAVASQFPSREALDQWLTRAIGPNRKYLDLALQHARQGLAGCPLQGEGYIYLAELTFLENEGSATKPAYVNQALKLRPQNSVVLLAAGSELALAGEPEAAVATWKRAFHNPEARRQIIEMMGPVAPAEFFTQSFDLDAIAGDQLFQHYRAAGRTRDAQTIAALLVPQFVERAKSNPKTAKHSWSRCCELYAYLGDDASALAAAEQALALDPGDFAAHHDYAHRLQQAGRLSEAAEEFKWCLQRKPDSAELQNEVQHVTHLLRSGASPPSSLR